MKHILTTAQFSKDDVTTILSRAREMEGYCTSGSVPKLLADKIVACMFFEPSTRTRLSFETAALKLGAQVISVENATSNSSSYKGETIEDTARTLTSYADAIVIRHPEKGMVARAASVTSKPVLNAGDGAHEHPSQALLDLYSILKENGRLDHLTFVFVGDILNSRTIHSLLPLLLHHEGNVFHFISPAELRLPEEYTKDLRTRGVTFFENDDLDAALPEADVLYMTRVQKERFEDMTAYDMVKDQFLLTKEHLLLMKEKGVILHPLPRVNEIDARVDDDARAAYFRQTENGLYVRMALLEYALQ